MLAGLFCLVVVVGLYVWTWRRIVRAAVARGRSRWFGHVVGFFFGLVPATFVVGALGATFPAPTQKPVDTVVAVMLWAFALGTIAALWRVTREPAPKPDITPPEPAPSTAQHSWKGWVETLRNAIRVDVPGDVRKTVPHGFDKATSAARPLATPPQTRRAAPRQPASIEPILLPDTISFHYRKADGQMRQRTVTAYLAEFSGFRQRIEGRDHDRNATRTFLLERIQGDITRLKTGEILGKAVWFAAVAESGGRTRTWQRRKAATAPKRESTDWQTAVFFAGFHETRQQRLAQQAIAAGWDVRHQLSRSVDYMVAGPLAGHRQFEKAEELGIPVIDEDAFSALV